MGDKFCNGARRPKIKSWSDALDTRDTSAVLCKTRIWNTYMLEYLDYQIIFGYILNCLFHSLGLKKTIKWHTRIHINSRCVLSNAQQQRGVVVKLLATGSECWQPASRTTRRKTPRSMAVPQQSNSRCVAHPVFLGTLGICYASEQNLNYEAKEDGI